ncbi:MAG: hypothetical protein PUC65_02440 [Clostridiales bacterium]|nr:hypothetical protein [Clostridiales bacterium]
MVMEFPFKDAPNTACLVCKHVLNKEKPILYVSHDAEDGMWQFLCGEEHTEEDAKIVSLNSAYMLDKTVGQLADMPCGYYVERNRESKDWI